MKFKWETITAFLAFVCVSTKALTCFDTSSCSCVPNVLREIPKKEAFTYLHITDNNSLRSPFTTYNYRNGSFAHIQ